MKILIINTHDQAGGAARAAYRLHKSLLSAGQDSTMLVLQKEGDDSTIIPMGSNQFMIAMKIAKSIKRIFNRIPENVVFSPNGILSKSVLKKIDEINPDVVHLHWINEGFIDQKILSKIKQPIVWSLHDMYPFTGGCHYDEGCGRFETKCEECPLLPSNRYLGKTQWKARNRHLSIIDNLTVVGLSKWLQGLAQKSSLLGTRSIVNLPNPIDSTVFAPIDKKTVRELLNLPQNKKLILFGAMVATSDKRKGFKELTTALQSLSIKDTELVVFGSRKPANAPNFGFPAHYLGHLHDDVTLRLLYSAADVMVVPSLQENLSNAIMESLSCATPVVAFDIGGNGDMISHKENGYLAETYSSDDLTCGIEWVLSLSDSDYKKVAENARETVLEMFDSKIIAKHYIELYASVSQSQ